MLRCREVTRLVASEDISHAGLLRRLEFRLHLMMCRHCREYVHQMGLIGQVARRLWGVTTEDPEALARIERNVLRAAEDTRAPFSPPSGGEKPAPPERPTD